MPGPSLSLIACFPFTSTDDTVRPTIFHRESLPMVLMSMLSGDCALRCRLVAMTRSNASGDNRPIERVMSDGYAWKGHRVSRRS